MFTHHTPPYVPLFWQPRGGQTSPPLEMTEDNPQEALIFQIKFTVCCDKALSTLQQMATSSLGIVHLELLFNLGLVLYGFLAFKKRIALEESGMPKQYKFVHPENPDPVDRWLRISVVLQGIKQVVLYERTSKYDVGVKLGNTKELKAAIKAASEKFGIWNCEGTTLEVRLAELVRFHYISSDELLSIPGFWSPAGSFASTTTRRALGELKQVSPVFLGRKPVDRGSQHLISVEMIENPTQVDRLKFVLAYCCSSTLKWQKPSSETGNDWTYCHYTDLPHGVSLQEALDSKLDDKVCILNKMALLLEQLVEERATATAQVNQVDFFLEKYFLGKKEQGARLFLDNHNLPNHSLLEAVINTDGTSRAVPKTDPWFGFAFAFVEMLVQHVEGVLDEQTGRRPRRGIKKDRWSDRLKDKFKDCDAKRSADWILLCQGIQFAFDNKTCLLVPNSSLGIE
ncbi:hypothetical protein T439DRAFT_354958 [Meredithblackwellia eburnea MCA 4105]